MARRFSMLPRMTSIAGMMAMAANTAFIASSATAVATLVSATSACSSTSAPAAPAPLASVAAERDAQGNYTLSWAPGSADTTVEVTAGTAPDAIDHGKIVARAAASAGTVTATGLDASRRWYFEVTPQGGAGTIVAERHVKLAGASNFRDLGGYVAADGRMVRWGAVYRSDALGKITAQDVDYLAGFGLSLAFDFRTDKEVQKAPDVIADGARIGYERGTILLPIDPQAILAAGTVIDEPFMIKVYTDILDTNGAIFAKVFRDLLDLRDRADPGTRSMVLHCTGGKDRTGIASALILAFLGVPDDVIVNDYALSDTYNAQAIGAQEEALRAQGIDPAKLGLALKAPPGVMRATLAHLRSKYGTVDAYLVSGGFDGAALAKVRAALLTEAHPAH